MIKVTNPWNWSWMEYTVDHDGHKQKLGDTIRKLVLHWHRVFFRFSSFFLVFYQTPLTGLNLCQLSMGKIFNWKWTGDFSKGNIWGNFLIFQAVSYRPLTFHYEWLFHINISVQIWWQLVLLGDLNVQYHLPLTHTSLSHNTIKFTGPKLWNSLNSSIQSVRSLNHFKSKFKHHLLNKYNVS